MLGRLLPQAARSVNSRLCSLFSVKTVKSDVKDYAESTYEKLTKKDRWVKPEERIEFKKRQQELYLKEDYKSRLLEARTIQQEPVIENDIIFGTDIPSLLKLSKANNKEMYMTDRPIDFEFLMSAKNDFLTQLQIPALKNPQFEKVFADVDEHIKKTYYNEGKESKFYHSVDFDYGNLYKNDEFLALKNSEFSKILQDLHFKELPGFVLRLARDAHNRNPASEIWRRVENSIYPNLHLLNTTELLVLYYALNFRSPKLCSITFRQQILRLIQEDMSRLSLQELLLLMMCQANCNKLSLFQECLRQVKSRSKEIIQLAREKGPDVMVNFFYAYVVSQIPGHVRKNTRGIEPDIVKEATEFLDLFLEELIPNVNKLSVSGLYRLSYALEHSHISNVYELYRRIELRLMKELDTYDPILQVEFIRVMSHISGKRSGASSAFWERVGKMITEKGAKFESYHAPILLQALASSSAATKETNAVLIPLCKKYLEKFTPNYTGLKTLMQGVMFANIKDEGLILSIVKTFSKMPYYAPAKYYSTFAQFRLHSEALFPDWTYTYYDNRCYHGKSEFIPFRGITPTQEKQLTEVYSMVSSIDQADIKMMFDWKGLYIVDFSMYPHLIGVVIDYEDSEPGKPECPRLALKKRLLKEHGWDIVNLKYSDFQNDPKTVIKKVVDELNTKYKKASKEKGTRDDILRKAHEERHIRMFNTVIPPGMRKMVLEEWDKKRPQGTA